ncbi:MAG: extracellular solute-binding protein [Clostridia bacterium]|nr:extracellular solute-binding protein [Clostridia bacterium]
MKREKITAFILVLAIALPLVTACHGSDGLGEFVIPEEFDTSRNYEITFWAKNDNNKVQTGVFETAIKDFEALYPNVKITLKLYADYGRIYNDVITNISTNTTPNICITYPDHIATYITGVNTVVPLDELFVNEKYGLGGSELRFDSPTYDEMIKKFVDECKIGDYHYAIPYMRSTEACYINKDIVEKLGYAVPDVLTWDFMWEVAEAAMKKDDSGNFIINGQKVMIPIIYKSTDNMMIQRLRQEGAGYSNEDGDILLFNDTAKRFLLDEVAVHAGTGAFSTFGISSYPGNMFNAGQCIFAIDSTAGATWIGTKANHMDISSDAVVDFETAVRMIPQVDVDNPKMISQGPSVCVFNKADSQEVLASWMFAQFLLTDKVQLGYAMTEGYAPVTQKARDTETYKTYLAASGDDNGEHYHVKIDATKLLLENTENTFITPVFNGSTSVRDAAGQMIENVTKSMRRKEKVDDEYIEKMYKDITALYRLDQRSDVAIGVKDLGKLPDIAIVLISSLAVAWALIIAYFAVSVIKKKKMKR